MQLTKAINNISESVISNSNKSIKLAPLQKLSDHVKEMAKTSTTAFLREQ